MALGSTPKGRAEARGHTKTSTFGGRAWIFGVGIGIEAGILSRHVPVQSLTEIDPDPDVRA